MTRIALVVVLAAGCFDDRYRCITDEQCDLGRGGTCELDGYCTSHDVVCDTRRSYEEHAGELANACYDDRIEPLNACAGGQPPAPRMGCFASVCDRLAACCDVAWTDACVQLAQEECDVTCDTRIALVAVRGATTERWHLRWDGNQWSISAETRLAPPLAWVAPAPGTIEPRLAGTTPSTLEIGDTIIPIEAGRDYQAITAIGLDRDNRDTIVAGYNAVDGTGAVLEIYKLDDLSVREVALAGNVDATALTWGDLDRDGFPDAVSRTTMNNYSYLVNLEDDRFARTLSAQIQSATSGGGTPGAPPMRTADWLDLDGDGRLDLVAFGASVRIHTSPGGARDIAERDLDCIPPSTDRACSDAPEPNLESASFAGCALPTADDPSVVIAAFPARKLFRARQQGDAVTVAPLPFPGDSCTCTASCSMCPGASCSCTYDCSACLTVLALVARDLDGDHRLDLIAIDSKLQLYTAFAADRFAWSMATAIPTGFASTFFNVIVSVSGAPLIKP